jgi:hypothetical protein
MAKIKDNPIETMRLDIEFADNGIILRNPDIEDEVTLALRTETLSTSLQRFCDFDHSEEYRAIGKKIYDWLTEVAVAEHSGHWITTGANLHIKAELTGRPKE